MAPGAQWMWSETSRLNMLNWSKAMPVSALVPVLEGIAKEKREKGVRVSVRDDVEEREYDFSSVDVAFFVLCGIADCSEAIRAIDARRLWQAEKERDNTIFGAWPPAAPAESCRQCMDCGAAAGDSCHLCGVALCSPQRLPGPRCLLTLPMHAGPLAPESVKACRRCASYAMWRGLGRTVWRAAIATACRGVMAANCFALEEQGFTPSLEELSDCAACGRALVRGLPGSMPHHCRACGRSLCSTCLCGSVTCSNTPMCPHKAVLPNYNTDQAVRVCRECLPVVQKRESARVELKGIYAIAERYVTHRERVMQFLEDPASFPWYKQEYVDTTQRKVVRAGNMAVGSVKWLTPMLSAPYAMGASAVHAVWNYGQYGLLGLICSDEIMNIMRTLNAMSKDFRNLNPKELVVGMLYLFAEHRLEARSTPEREHREAIEGVGASEPGRELDDGLLEMLIGLAGIGMHAPYEQNAFEVQRLAWQQNWRLVTERISESGKHRPAWCLYAHQEHEVAAIAIRGTDLDKSLGGDLFTDLNAEPVVHTSGSGATVIAHEGMLRSAIKLEAELRHTLRALARRGRRIIIVGHSLGAGVACLLLWLLKHGGSDKELLPADAELYGVGFATPSVVDRGTAELMRPYFVSVVNSVDIVPRLQAGSIQQLTEELVSCARASHADLDADLDSYADRIASLWAPRVRRGTQAEPHTPMHESSTEDSVAASMFRRLSRHATAALESVQGVERAPLADMSVGGVQLKKLEISEGESVLVQGGADKVHLAWWGKRSAQAMQQNRPGTGEDITETIRALLRSSFAITATPAFLGDPCPGSLKKLTLFVWPCAQGEHRPEELFIPGNVAWIYRHCGSLQASVVSCTTPSLRRIRVDKRMISDHGKLAYHRAMLTVRAFRTRKRTVRWQSFGEAGEVCPCCHSIFDWSSTTRSRKQRCLWMTNCRSCGQVVCTSCSSQRQADQDAGIIEPARICDSCAWRGPDGGAALGRLPELFRASCASAFAPSA